MENTVKFDPGIGEYVVNFNEYVNSSYSQLMSLTTIHQKKIRFKILAQKIEKYMKNNICFYIGCLLWAYYLHNEYNNSPKEIEGNFFLNLTEEEKNNYDYLIQVNFMENYFDCFERDTLYYTGNKKEIPDLWKQVLKLYTNFLELNKGFTNTKLTSDIILPEKLKEIKNAEKIKETINKAIEEKNLEIFLNTDFFN